MPISKEAKVNTRRKYFPKWMDTETFVLGWVGRNAWRKQVWVAYELIYRLRSGSYWICEDCGKVSLTKSERITRIKREIAEELPKSESRQSLNGRCRHCGSTSVRRPDPFTSMVLWLHMARDESLAAWPCEGLEWTYNLVPNRDIFYTEGYSSHSAIPSSQMPVLYQMWDCLLFLSGAEGFGLPAWEAMASGLPVVYTDYSSHSEFLSDSQAGISVSGILQPEPRTCTWRIIADVEQCVVAVRSLYYDRQKGARLGQNGTTYIKDFSIEKQTDRLHNTLQHVLS